MQDDIFIENLKDMKVESIASACRVEMSYKFAVLTQNNGVYPCWCIYLTFLLA
jgi:hypothetical protein